MRISKDFLREAIQLVNTKRPQIKFEIGKEVTDKKLGQIRTYKLHKQPKEKKPPVKHVFKGQNMTNVDALYTFIQDLLRGNTLTAFNNEQAMLESQSPENLKHCLNAVTVQMFPNKAYTLQKRYL
eukprot:11370652-Ditylum_brightwellii.AAC.1